jgi:hypothetical protein
VELKNILENLMHEHHNLNNFHPIDIFVAMDEVSYVGIIHKDLYRDYYNLNLLLNLYEQYLVSYDIEMILHKHYIVMAIQPYVEQTQV